MEKDYSPQFQGFKEKVESSFKKQAFPNYLGIKLTKIEAGYCEMELPFKADLGQQDGFMHAGVVATIADNAAGYAALSLMKENARVLSIEFKVNLLRPANGDLLLAKAKVLRYGKQITVAETKVYTRLENGFKLCSSAVVSLIQILPK